MEVLGAGGIDVLHRVTQVIDTGGVTFHLLVGRIQLRAVHRVGAVCRQLARRHVGDPVHRRVAVARRIGVLRRIPLQRILLQARHVTGDVLHRRVGGVQLRAVHRVGTGRRQTACRHVGHGAFAAHIPHADRAGRVRPGKRIVGPAQGDPGRSHRRRRFRVRPQRHIVLVAGNGAHPDGHRVQAQRRRVGPGGVGVEVLGAGGIDVLHRVTQVIDTGGVTFHLLVGRIQLRAVHRVGADLIQIAIGYPGDLIHSRIIMTRGIGVQRLVPQQRIVLQSIYLVKDIVHCGVGGIQLRTVDRIGAGF